ncbi:sel1 repeat family protein [Pseudomonadota bacterium]|nr:sel1 repeat family protein [Pseudomonadota bacterium]
MMLLLLNTACDISNENEREIQSRYEEGQKAYSRKNYGLAFSNFEWAAKQGDSSAQLSLGNMYFNGQGVKKDYIQALKWFKSAHDSGDVNAIEGINKIAETGLGYIEKGTTVCINADYLMTNYKNRSLGKKMPFDCQITTSREKVQLTYEDVGIKHTKYSAGILSATSTTTFMGVEIKKIRDGSISVIRREDFKQD